LSFGFCNKVTREGYLSQNFNVDFKIINKFIINHAKVHIYPS
jgi:hypothetical protein